MSGFLLKLLMAAAMLLDHIGEFFPHTAPVWFRWIGRVVAPVFFFLMVEGMAHTRDRTKYIARLSVAGGVMLAGNFLLSLLLRTDMPPNNIFLSLAVSAALIYAIDFRKGHPNRLLGPVAVVVPIFAMLFVEGNFLCLALTLVFFLNRGKTAWLGVWYLIITAALTILPHIGRLSADFLLFQNPQWMMAFALPFIFVYNSKKGPDHPAAKWFFYGFYPLHIWALFVLSHL